MSNFHHSLRDNVQAQGESCSKENEILAKVPLSSWTDFLPDSIHNTFFKDTNWASTPLGPLESWSPSLQFAVNMMFNDSRGAAIYWGSDLTAMYNETFIETISGAHPILMGHSFRIGFASTWEETKSIFDTVFKEGKCVEFQRMQFLMQKGNGYLEEAYFVGQFIPLKGPKGKVEGTYNSGYEITTQVLYERRRAQLDKLAAVTTTSMPEMFKQITETLKCNARDVSMALIYSVDEETHPGKTSVKLECNVGVPNGHMSAPADGILNESHVGYLPFLKKAKATMAPIVFLESSDNLHQNLGHLLDGVEWQGWGEPCRDVSIIPLQSASGLIGFMVIATNPRRKYDQSSAQFVSDLAQQIVIKWSSAITVKSAYRREQRLLQELADTEQRIRHMALNAPVGMVHLTVEGKVSWANDQWYDITSNVRENINLVAWIECYTEASQQEAARQWDNLEKGLNTTCELQLRRKFTPPVPDDIEHHAWVLALGFPMMVDGKVKYVMGTLTDVSHLKWAESVQARNADRAAKAKRQQEEFIDVTSHEMRNPLSAMYQCASMISTSLNGVNPETDKLLEVVQSNVEAANTIMMCAAHQKRIIDDVLILNRLDTMMLSITPVAVKIPETLNAVVKMFQAELDVAGVESQILQQPSFDKHVPTLVFCDSSRLTQIFINLITNAIKFIRNCEKRVIRVRYGVTLEPPTDNEVTMTTEKFHWSPKTSYTVDPTTDSEWGTGQPLYLCFSIQDTGPGLEEDEIPRLFSRFSQANSKTHITYGGSGLGLYISNALAQRQGGRMGIASTKGHGTTIAFYIKSKIAVAPSLSRQVSMQGDCLGKSNTTIVNGSNPKKRRTTFSDPASDTNSAPVAKVNLLLVEDNLINQRVLRKQLQKADCKVHVANHGLEALSFLHKTTNWATASCSSSSDETLPSIDVILMDWEMPEMDGLTCTKQIRAIEAERSLPRLPIVGITANARDEQIQSAVGSGMDDVITKPFLVQDLLIKVRHWISRKSEESMLE